MQVSSSEWVLGVQIQHFENKYNAEIRQNMYCCCDDSDIPCGASIDAVKSMTCTTTCQPLYVVYFQACPSTEMCYIAKNINFTLVNLNSVISSLLIQIPLNQSELEMYNQVSICNCIVINNTI